MGREKCTHRKRSRDEQKESKRVEALNTLWEGVDKCSSVTKLINAMRPLLHVDKTACIHRAACDSGKAVAQLFADRLCLDRKRQVATVIAAHFDVAVANVEAAMPPTYTVIINGGPRRGTIRHFNQLVAEVDPKKFYDLIPLHMAVLAGNVSVFNRFTRHKYQATKHTRSVFLYALLYAKHSGFNWDLINRTYGPALESELEEIMDTARLSSTEQVQVVAYLHGKGQLHNLEYDAALFINAIKAGEDDLARALYDVEGGWEPQANIYDAIIDEAPQTDARLMSWGDELDINFAEIRDELGETGQLIWDVETGVYDEEPDYDHERWAAKVDHWHNLVLESAPNVDVDILRIAVRDYNIDLGSIAKELDCDELVIFKERVGRI